MATKKIKKPRKTVMYDVYWTINVGASSPRAAARKAFRLMQVPTDATYFEVKPSVFNWQPVPGTTPVDLGYITKTPKSAS